MVHDYWCTAEQEAVLAIVDKQTGAAAAGLSGDGGASPTSGGSVRPGCAPGRDRPPGRRYSSDGVGLARGLETRGPRGAAVGGPGRAAAEAHGRAAGRGDGGVVERPDGQRVSDRAVDAGPGGWGDRAGHRGEVSPGPCVADSAGAVGLESSASGSSGRRTRRRRHRAVGAGTVAASKKRARRRGALIVFEDESGVSLLPCGPRGRPGAKHPCCVIGSTGSGCPWPGRWPTNPTAPRPSSFSRYAPGPTTTKR